MNTSGAPAIASSDVLGARAVAGIIDVVLMLALFYVVGLLIGNTEKDEGDVVSVTLENGPLVVYLALVFAYHFLAEAFAGGTVGKKLMKLKVVSRDSKPDIGAFALRNLFRFVDFLPGFYLLGFLMTASRSDRRRLGDLVAGTDVVRDRLSHVGNSDTA